jgi:hypothetical protein
MPLTDGSQNHRTGLGHLTRGFKETQRTQVLSTVGRFSLFGTYNQWVRLGYMYALNRWFSKPHGTSFDSVTRGFRKTVLTLNQGSEKIEELSQRTYSRPLVHC